MPSSWRCVVCFAGLIFALLNPCQADFLADLLEPGTLEQFQTRFYNNRTHVVKRSLSQREPFLKMIGEMEPLAMAAGTALAFAEHGYQKYAAGVTLRNSAGKVQLNNGINTSADILELYDQHVSFVVKGEELYSTMSPLQQALHHHFSTDITVHAYVSPGAAQALKVCYLCQCVASHLVANITCVAAHGSLRRLRHSGVRPEGLDHLHPSAGWQ